MSKAGTLAITGKPEIEVELDWADCIRGLRDWCYIGFPGGRLPLFRLWLNRIDILGEIPHATILSTCAERSSALVDLCRSNFLGLQ